MRVVTKFIFLIPVGLTITILLSIFIPSNISWTLPLPVPIYFIVAYILIIIIAFGEIARALTTPMISNIGHQSIRFEDIKKIPWEEPIYDEDKKKIIHEKRGDLIFSLPGGINKFDLSIPGGPERPIWVFPAPYLEKVENSYKASANLFLYDDFSELPKSVKKEAMKPKYKNRIDIKKTPFYYGTTSREDGSDTPPNLKKERMDRDINKEIEYLEKMLDRILTAERKFKERMEKNVVVGQPIKPVESE